MSRSGTSTVDRAGAPSSAFVTGSSGALGLALTTELRQAGSRRVTGLLRSARKVSSTEPFRVCVADAREADWPMLITGHDVVFHLAAYVHRIVTNAEEARELQDVNVEVTARIARACRDAGVRLVFASSVAVYGAPAGVASDETVPAPRTPYGESKLAAEDVIRAEGVRGLRYTILRFPLLYGAHGRGNMEKMLRAIASRRYLPIGDPATPKACLHFSDAARALRAAADPSVPDGSYVVAPREMSTLGEIHAAAYAAVDRWMPPHLPSRVARLAAVTGDFLLCLSGRRPRLSAAVDTLAAPSAFDGSRFAFASGFTDVVHVREGMRRTARWLRENNG